MKQKLTTEKTKHIVVRLIHSSPSHCLALGPRSSPWPWKTNRQTRYYFPYYGFSLVFLCVSVLPLVQRGSSLQPAFPENLTYFLDTFSSCRCRKATFRRFPGPWCLPQDSHHQCLHGIIGNIFPHVGSYHQRSQSDFTFIFKINLKKRKSTHPCFVGKIFLGGPNGALFHPAGKTQSTL